MVYTLGGAATSQGRLARVPQPRCSEVLFHPEHLLATVQHRGARALIDIAIEES